MFLCRSSSGFGAGCGISRAKMAEPVMTQQTTDTAARLALRGHQKMAKDIQQVRAAAIREKSLKKAKQISAPVMDKLVVQAYKELMEEGFNFPGGNPLLENQGELLEMRAIIDQEQRRRERDTRNTKGEGRKRSKDSTAIDAEDGSHES